MGVRTHDHPVMRRVVSSAGRLHPSRAHGYLIRQFAGKYGKYCCTRDTAERSSVPLQSETGAEVGASSPAAPILFDSLSIQQTERHCLSQSVYCDGRVTIPTTCTPFPAGGSIEPKSTHGRHRIYRSRQREFCVVGSVPVPEYHADVEDTDPAEKLRVRFPTRHSNLS